MNNPAPALAGLRHDVPLAPLTTLGIGGPARCYLRADSVEEARAGFAWAAAAGLPTFVLGGGSNVVMADQGYPGLVLHVGLRGREVTPQPGGEVLVRAGAGEPWDDFVAWTVGDGLAGLECLSGIPGLVGATPIQNVGAYGQEVAETIVAVEAIERAGGGLRRFSAAECAFRYRQSVFKGAERDRWVVVAVTFRLRPGGPPAIRYADLERRLQEAGHAEPTLAEVRETVIAIRRGKGMVVDPADPDSRSDGSFFMNPVVDEATLERVAALARERGHESFPRFATAEGTKLSAGWLIENAGFHRGYRLGGVGLSSKHALAIVNREGGRAAEVRALAETIREGVEEAFGVRLEPEPNFIGC